jgi:hypothetical protein
MMALLLGVIVAVFLTVGAVLLYEAGGWQVLIVLGIVAAVAVCSWLIARKTPLAESQAPSRSPSDLMRQREGLGRREGLPLRQVGRMVAIAVAALVSAATVVGLVILLARLVPSRGASSPNGEPLAAALGTVVLALVGLVVILFTLIILLYEANYIVRLAARLMRRLRSVSEERAGENQAPDRSEEQPP